MKEDWEGQKLENSLNRDLYEIKVLTAKKELANLAVYSALMNSQINLNNALRIESGSRVRLNEKTIELIGAEIADMGLDNIRENGYLDQEKLKTQSYQKLINFQTSDGQRLYENIIKVS